MSIAATTMRPDENLLPVAAPSSSTACWANAIPTKFNGLREWNSSSSSSSPPAPPTKRARDAPDTSGSSGAVEATGMIDDAFAILTGGPTPGEAPASKKPRPAPSAWSLPGSRRESFNGGSAGGGQERSLPFSGFDKTDQIFATKQDDDPLQSGMNFADFNSMFYLNINRNLRGQSVLNTKQQQQESSKNQRASPQQRPQQQQRINGGGVPGDGDILLGRGRKAQNHSGNVLFRAIVDRYSDRYEETKSKSGKSKLIREVVAYIYDQRGSRFLGQDALGRWTILVDRETAREKVSHAFRNKKRLARQKDNSIRKANSSK